MSRVKYPEGIYRGALVRLVRELRTAGGTVFAKGEILEVGEATCGRRGTRGRPRVSLWDRAKPWNWDGQGATSRGIRNVEVEDYELADALVKK